MPSRAPAAGPASPSDSGSSDTPPLSAPPPSRRGRAARIGVALAVLIVTLIGTFAGQDSDFPFGPFRMYSTRDDPNAPVSSTRIDGITATSERLVVSGAETGMRRAEVEGQLERFEKHPQLLGALAQAYERRHPGRRLVAMEIVVRKFALSDGRATGAYTDTVLARWERP